MAETEKKTRELIQQEKLTREYLDAVTSGNVVLATEIYKKLKKFE